MIQIIKKAIANKNKLEIIYKKNEYESPTKRIIHPYRVYSYSDFDGIYLDAYCELRNEDRIFRIDRIINLVVLNINFYVAEEKLSSNNFMSQEGWKNKTQYFDNYDKFQNNSYRNNYKGYKSYSKKPKNSNCFVATAVFKNSDAYEVKVLKNWRDAYLMEKFWGNIFIKFYYKIGPVLAISIENNQSLYKFCKLMILYIIKKIEEKNLIKQ